MSSQGGLVDKRSYCITKFECFLHGQVLEVHQQHQNKKIWWLLDRNYHQHCHVQYHHQIDHHDQNGESDCAGFNKAETDAGGEGQLHGGH